MRTEFKSVTNMMDYIGKTVSRSTDIKKVCQYCGKPAHIKYNKENPFLIQLVCPDCKLERNAFTSTNVDSMFRDIPLIDIREHLTSNRLNEDVYGIDPIIESKFDYILTSSFGKCEALEYLGVSKSKFDRWLNIYDEKNPGIKEQIYKRLSSNTNKKIRETRLKNTLDYNAVNNLSKIKYERDLTNADLVRMTNNQINKPSLSLICTGKSNPTIRTKCALAEALSLSIAEIFPSDYLYTGVYSYQDYLDYNQLVRDNLSIYVENKKEKGQKYIINDIAEVLGVSKNNLYCFLEGASNYDHSRLSIIVDNILEGYLKGSIVE